MGNPLNDAVVDLVPVHGNAAGGIHAKAGNSAIHTHHHNADVVTNADHIVGSAHNDGFFVLTFHGPTPC
jgi:hypothetical protein